MKQKLTLPVIDRHRAASRWPLARANCYKSPFRRLPPRYGVQRLRPGPGFVWARLWDWRGGNWFWVNGGWRRPPYRGAVWVAPPLGPYGHHYRMVRGYWRR